MVDHLRSAQARAAHVAETMTGDPCALCASADLSLYHEDTCRTYWVCPNCALVQVPSEYRLSAEQEKAEYDQHDNRVDDDGYRRFLARSAEQVLTHFAAPAEGLDFGCGPGPALAAMLSEAGHSVTLYDWFYHRDEAVWHRQYDFITATEVVEHLHAPAGWLERLWQSLKPGGMLVIQTKRVISKQHFADWHYIRDPTHVMFFSIATLHWLAQRWKARVRLAAPDVAVFYRAARDSSAAQDSGITP